MGFVANGWQVDVFSFPRRVLRGNNAMWLEGIGLWRQRMSCKLILCHLMASHLFPHLCHWHNSSYLTRKVSEITVSATLESLVLIHLFIKLATVGASYMLTRETQRINETNRQGSFSWWEVLWRRWKSWRNGEWRGGGCYYRRVIRQELFVEGTFEPRPRWQEAAAGWRSGERSTPSSGAPGTLRQEKVRLRIKEG